MRPHVPRRSATVEYGDLAIGEHAYGYLWWHDRYRFTDGVDVEVVHASGNGGQRLWIVPDLHLVVVHLTGNYNQPGASWRAERLLLERVVPWARGEAGVQPRLPAGRPVQFIGPDEWKKPSLSRSERARYLGSYDEQGTQVEVWEEDGVLKMTPPPGDDQREIHLIPEGAHVFAQGRYKGGRPVKLYWPDARIVFEVLEGRATRWEVRSRGKILGSAERIPEGRIQQSP
jgi:hypothetical protein